MKMTSEKFAVGAAVTAWALIVALVLLTGCRAVKAEVRTPVATKVQSVTTYDPVEIMKTMGEPRMIVNSPDGAHLWFWLHRDPESCTVSIVDIHERTVEPYAGYAIPCSMFGFFFGPDDEKKKRKGKI